jgi:hypothetical protein
MVLEEQTLESNRVAMGRRVAARRSTRFQGGAKERLAKFRLRRGKSDEADGSYRYAHTNMAH